jgi:branched-chain amino acid transport system permease protein
MTVSQSVENNPEATERSARRRTSLPAQGIVGLVVLGVGYFVYARPDEYHLDVTLSFVVYALLALGMYTPVFMCGKIDLAYNAYFAAGAYSVAIVASRTELPILLAVPLGAAVAATIAGILGALTSRLTGFHLALVTLAAGMAVYAALIDASEYTGGASGLGSIPWPTIFGIETTRDRIVLVGLLLVWLISMALASLRRSLLGLSLRLFSESGPAAESSGVPTRAVQVWALMAGASIASLAGSIMALMNQFILADSFNITIVFLVLFLPIIGGVTSPWGAVIGAFVLSALNQASGFVDGPGPLVFGVVTLVMLVAFPAGILGIPRLAMSRARHMRQGGGSDE